MTVFEINQELLCYEYVPDFRNRLKEGDYPVLWRKRGCRSIWEYSNFYAVCVEGSENSLFECVSKSVRGGLTAFLLEGEKMRASVNKKGSIQGGN